MRGGAAAVTEKERREIWRIAANLVALLLGISLILAGKDASDAGFGKFLVGLALGRAMAKGESNDDSDD